MRHRPHLLLVPPWDGPLLAVDDVRHRHLSRVLRLGDGAAIGYTDGAGRRGQGVFEAGYIRRGSEELVDPIGPSLTLAVAPPRVRDRTRFIVEKAAELGVEHLLWLQTVNGEGKPPKADKAQAWADAALEQSQGVMRMHVGGMVNPLELGDGLVVVAERMGGRPDMSGADRVTLMVGPEGGFTPSEIPPSAVALGLGPTVLRVETAAIVGTAILLAGSARWASPDKHWE